MADAEGQAVVAHQAVGDFLGGRPVAVEFFERAGGIDRERREHLAKAREHRHGGLHHAGVLLDALAVDHAGHDVVRAQEGYWTCLKNVKHFSKETRKNGLDV